MHHSSQEQDFFEKMADVIAQRYQANADKSLTDVYQLNKGFLSTETDADFVIRSRSRILEVLKDKDNFERLVELFVHLTIEFTYARNQFIQINLQEEAELRRIYTDYLRQMEQVLAQNSTDTGIANGLRTLVAGHFVDLRANISRFFDPETVEVVQANVIFNEVVCAEYDPELQLDILGVQIEDMVEPVIDLGCGKSGLLVKYLNQNGIRAVGVDRTVDLSQKLIQSDWLDYRLGSEAWGTIISHMAFSNHFVFHHLYRHGSVEPYARQYMAILKSLKVGGRFFYAPGLPFIEAFLPREKYIVTRKKVIDQDKLYACQVLRAA